ncbi:MAG TPA: DNA-binding protein WhiA [Clostridiales bacterium]|nr:DNA-binding protein WhiA [Clostridiales bacterium]
MSFSLEVKDALCRMPCEKACCMACEISAILTVGADPAPDGSRVVSTEHAAFAGRLFKMLKALTGTHPVLHYKRETNLKKHMLYKVILPSETVKAIRQDPEPRRSCCRKAWLRGAFLAGGSMVHPEKGYHLEITCPDRSTAEKIADRMKGFGLHPGTAARSSGYIVYIKESANISDFLNLTGAHGALMVFENVRIMKDVRNSVNRIVNCETANLDKTVEASRRQRECILKLISRGGADDLPHNLRQIAILRLEHPEASLEELGKYLRPPLGKSGVNHRLKKIEMLAGLPNPGK